MAGNAGRGWTITVGRSPRPLGQQRRWLHLRERRCRFTRVLSVDVVSQVVPDIVGHIEEYLDDLRVELTTGPEADFFADSLHALSLTVIAVRPHGVERVSNRENSRSERDLLTLQASRISQSVIALLVGIN